MYLLINVVAFKVGWASTIFGAANGLPLLGPAVVLMAIAIHLRNATYPGDELLLVFITGIVGAFWDSILVAAGWLTYPTGTLISGVAPYWIVAMWMLFATTLNLAFRWLRGRIAFAALLGAVFGPLSYFTGAKIGAVIINEFVPTMIALSVAWAVLMPALLWLAEKLDGFHVPSNMVDANV